MFQSNALTKMMQRGSQVRPRPRNGGVERLSSEHQSEVLKFLSRRPLHTVAMVGFIRDNGLVSTLNRGMFYGYRQEGRLEGVALIGHATLFETCSDRALEAFANLAQKCTTAHMILGEQDRIEQFWSCYSEGGQELRLACRELLFELHWPIEVHQGASDLRLATLDDLELVMPVQAQMACEESGVNPLEKDPHGFRERCTRRVNEGRTWVWEDQGELRFKADVISATREVIYLEGIWLNEATRHTGEGLRCMSWLSRELLSQTKSICLLVNEKNKPAHAFYKKCGYKIRSTYDTVFLSQRESIV